MSEGPGLERRAGPHPRSALRQRHVVCRWSQKLTWARTDRGSPPCVTCNESNLRGWASPRSRGVPPTRRRCTHTTQRGHPPARADSCVLTRRPTSTGVTCIFSWLGLLSFTRRSYHAAAMYAHHTAWASTSTGGQWRSDALPAST